MSFRVRTTRIGLLVGVAAACISVVSACSSSNTSTATSTSTGSSNSNTLNSNTSACPPNNAVSAAIRDKFPKAVLQQGTLRVGLGAPSPPASILVNGAVAAGTDYCFLKAVADLAGLKAEFTPLAFSAVIPSIQADKTDITGDLVPSAARIKVANFVVVDKVPWGLLLPYGNPLHIKSSANLCGLTVSGAQGGITYLLVAARNQDTCTPEHKPAIKLRLYATQDAAILAVKAGQAAVFPQAESVTSYVAKTTDNGTAFTSIPDLKGVDGTVYFAEGFGVLTSDHQLLTAVQAAFQELVADGTYQKILDQYGLGDEAIKDITVNNLSAEDLKVP